MSEFKSALKPYDLEVALTSDRGDDCLVIDVSRRENGHLVASLEQVVDLVESYLSDKPELVLSATKLYVVGDWDSTPCSTTAENDTADDAAIGDADATAKWQAATTKIRCLIKQMDNLRELTWVSGLPFTSAVWEALPATLTKLVLDLGEPVWLEQDGDMLHKLYITANEMQPLQDQVELRELRLLRVRDSLQSLVWETVFRNTSEGSMRVLDIQMASEPIVRSEQWRKAKDVAGLTVPTAESEEKEYKGTDGKGVLHYTIGTGEYLDGYCIRKARIASGLDEATPLPLWCLKLDGFVIDHLPFEHELSHIVLLTCGEKCVDSGLRAPKSKSAAKNKWSRAVNNATSHCLIQWPNWTGIFDDQGDQRDRLGVVVPQELGLSTPADEMAPFPVAPLSDKPLNLKHLDDALEAPTQRDYFSHVRYDSFSPAAHPPLSALSDLSTPGSEWCPPPSATSSFNGYSPAMSAGDGAYTTMSSSFCDELDEK